MNNEPVGFIYIIKNSINGMFYIGATKRPLQNRLHSHYISAKSIEGFHEKGIFYSAGRSKIFQDDLCKYGEDGFSIELVENVYNLSEMNEIEKYWIDKFYGNELMYNIRKSGYNGLWGKKI